MHHGAVVDGVDERGEVGLLTRNILIRGAVQNACYGMAECAYIPDNVDLFGGMLIHRPTKLRNYDTNT